MATISEKNRVNRKPILQGVRLRVEFKCPYCDTGLVITEMNLHGECACRKRFRIDLEDLVREEINRAPRFIPPMVRTVKKGK